MKITTYSAKGSAGKTPIATNIALDRNYSICTNEPYHILDTIIPKERIISVKSNERFPEIPEDRDIVFDLAGSVPADSSIVESALRQSDLVIVPIYNEIKSLNSGINTILIVSQITKNILVVATKLQKKQGEMFTSWENSREFSEIRGTVDEYIDFDVPVLPLKYSKVFDAIFEKGKSIRQIMKSEPLASYTYRHIATQFDEIYAFIDKAPRRK
uniref:CobQ/CobB/MinD/ParA nucleotide binding domain-containing protein n=1 Tax=Candidatus Kentrum sp. FM TaxID=2126340 RepID=A0A450WXY6_9GAMM|nr:MAG: hypothetical protein BECKFM1743C_GA0114222_102094 [Candidatus Kentron sp. FM]VFJ74624.1 MAG: hypothetical protein BECKFM1743A_GA0114220_107892 [Candidatus Kentron sp. FM]VFK21883.1 MAG: hypothetical protein BECKFM1743B_GA0114221_108221 [Candidatus Kentron sp. FM]